MQNFKESGSMTYDVSGLMDNFDEGAYCETTRRVVIISPFPAAVRSLVMALTEMNTNGSFGPARFNPRWTKSRCWLPAAGPGLRQAPSF